MALRCTASMTAGSEPPSRSGVTYLIAWTLGSTTPQLTPQARAPRLNSVASTRRERGPTRSLGRLISKDLCRAAHAALSADSPVVGRAEPKRHPALQ